MNRESRDGSTEDKACQTGRIPPGSSGREQDRTQTRQSTGDIHEDDAPSQQADVQQLRSGTKVQDQVSKAVNNRDGTAADRKKDRKQAARRHEENRQEDRGRRRRS